MTALSTSHDRQGVDVLKKPLPYGRGSSKTSAAMRAISTV